jgi:hypothetical protein
VIAPAEKVHATEKDSIPRVQHIRYFQVILEGIADGHPFDRLRDLLRNASVEMALREEARAVGPRVDDGYTLWNPTAKAIGEMMRLGLVTPQPLPSKRSNVDSHRDNVYALTPEGQALVAVSGRQESTFRSVFTPLLMKQHPYFASVLAAIAEEPLVIPEYTEEALVGFQETARSWTTALAADAASRMSQMSSARPSTEDITSRVRDGLAKRFPPGSEPTRKDILDAVQDALIVATLEARGIRMDATSFNVITSWGRQVFVLNESRYVLSLQGRVVWSTADIVEAKAEVLVKRRGLSEFGDTVSQGLAKAYRSIVDSMSDEFDSGGFLFPYLDIFRVRALTAFKARVNVSVVDRVIAEIVTHEREVAYSVELALGARTTLPASEPPFRLNGRRYYVMLIKPKGD